LLVILQLNYLLEYKEAAKIKSRFKTLPKTPTEAYRNVLDRMTPGDADLARRVLDWLLNAARVLAMSELREALAIQIDPTLDEDNILDAELVVRVCGGLITHNRDNDLVTFSHETVRHYFEEQERGATLSPSDLCKACLRYFQLPAFHQADIETSEIFSWDRMYRLSSRFKRFKFLIYACEFWAFHAIQSSRAIELEEEIVKTMLLPNACQMAVDSHC
jgi:hypothetical protein